MEGSYGLTSPTELDEMEMSTISRGEGELLRAQRIGEASKVEIRCDRSEEVAKARLLVLLFVTVTKLLNCRTSKVETCCNKYWPKEEPGQDAILYSLIRTLEL